MKNLKVLKDIQILTAKESKVLKGGGAVKGVDNLETKVE